MNTAREIHIARPCIEDPWLFIAESSVTIYRKGRIDIRRVLNVYDASRAIDMIEQMLQNSFIE